MKGYYESAKPFLEKAASNDAYSSAEQISLCKSLKRIYDNLGEKDKSLMMSSKIKSLEGGQ
jgi:hypothetical protein